MPSIIAKENISHGNKDFNFSSYSHAFITGYLFGFDAHWHDEWEIIYVRDGVFRFYVDGELFTVKKNQALFIDRYAIHVSSDYDIRNGSGYNCLVFGMHFLCPDKESYIYRKYFRKMDSVTQNLTQCITGDKEFEQEILRQIRLLDEFSICPEQNALSIQIALLSIFDILLREHSEASLQPKVTVKNNLVKAALLYMNQGKFDSIQVHDIAASLNISTDHFIRLFRTAVGITPKQYIQSLRIQKAVSLMQSEPELLISEIVRQTGFDDVNYFSRVFKHIVGVSPSGFRKQQLLSDRDPF